MEERSLRWDYFVPLAFGFFSSSSGFSFFGFLISLGMISSNGLNKTYKKEYFENIIPAFFYSFHKKIKNLIEWALTLESVHSYPHKYF